jgi:HEAT repeat protein
MAVNAARMAGEWFGTLAKKDTTSRLIEKAKADQAREERLQAITNLGNSGDYGAVKSLIDCCQDMDPQIRRSAIAGLQNLRSGRAAGVLIERLRDKEELPEIRQHAAAALAAIRSYRAMQELRARYADNEEDRALRFFISGELHRVQYLVSPGPGPVSSS